MSSSNTQDKTIPWAISLFRPVLQGLGIRTLQSEKQLLLSQFRELHRYSMERCVVIVKRFKFNKPSYNGLFIWRYDEEHNFYALYILLNDNMYSDEEHTSCVKRKLVAVHEFIHCIASLLTFSRIKTKLLINSRKEKMLKTVHAIESADIDNLLKELRLDLKDKKDTLEIFPDNHFRTYDEDFLPSYSDLYQQMLMSDALIKEYFSKDEITDFFNCLTEDSKEATKILIKKIQTICTEKSLDYVFVKERLLDYLIALKTVK